jgi:arabinose-5-phosphate isomerase
MTFDVQKTIRLAQDTLDIEASAVLGLKARINQAFVDAVQAILAVRGRVVVMGMGKSGHIGRKIAATLASTGTPAMFVHPAEASHGDLGMIKSVDLVIAISNSGESDELNAILPMLKRQGVPLIAMTGGAMSTLAQHADITLDSSVAKEACPLNLAPTASTTAQLALGDALAVTLLDARGFKAEDFARSHPWLFGEKTVNPCQRRDALRQRRAKSACQCKLQRLDAANECQISRRFSHC